MTEIYPFGRPVTSRPPRKPVAQATLFVLGVYPSALHVRWTPPEWTGSGPVGALAVDDEPTVFWDGVDAAERVEAWKAAVGFVAGHGTGEWGSVVSAGNGTSGDKLLDGLLGPLHVRPDEVWFTDAVDRFLVKRGTATRRQQANLIDTVYNPFANRVDRLSAASIRARPSPAKLVAEATANHGDRLRAELLEAQAPLIVTLGEEARRVLAGIGALSGPPTVELSRPTSAGLAASYGRPGVLQFDGHSAAVMALKHPGQRGPDWTDLHETWSTTVGS